MNHANCIERYSGKLTVESALKSDLIKLSELKTIYKENTPFYFIESWLLQLNIFVNTENKLSGEQIKELARYVYDEVYMLNIAEFTLLFKRIKNGHYGVFYNRIDATQIVAWCRLYRAERTRFYIPLVNSENEQRDYEQLKARIENENIIENE